MMACECGVAATLAAVATRPRERGAGVLPLAGWSRKHGAEQGKQTMDTRHWCHVLAAGQELQERVACVLERLVCAAGARREQVRGSLACPAACLLWCM